MPEDAEEKMEAVDDEMTDTDTLEASESEEGPAVADDAEGETAMREMIDYIARVLVEDTDAVQVDSAWRDDRLVVNLKVAETDKGKVIGRNGRVVQAMQSLLRVAATKSNMRVNLDVE